MTFFGHTRWEVLETYQFDMTWFCVQVRMRKRDGFKKFKVTKITKSLHNCYAKFTPEQINSVVMESMLKSRQTDTTKPEGKG